MQHFKADSINILSFWALHCPALPAHNTFSGAQDYKCMLVSRVPCQLPDFVRIPAFNYFLFRESYVVFFFLLGPQGFICFCSSGNKANPPGLHRQLQHNVPFLSMSSPKVLSGIFTPQPLMLCTTVNWAALCHLSSKSPPLPNLLRKIIGFQWNIYTPA